MLEYLLGGGEKVQNFESIAILIMNSRYVMIHESCRSVKMNPFPGSVKNNRAISA